MAFADYFRFDLSGQTRSPDLGAGYWDQVAEDKKFPGISPTGDPGDFPDPDVPAVAAPDKTVLNLLEQIRDRLPVPDTRKVWISLVQTMTTVGAEYTFSHAQEWTYFFLSNPTTRPVNVYLGRGRTLFLGTLPAGKNMVGDMPFGQHDLTVTWAAGGTSDEQLSVILSTGKIDVEIV